MVWRLPRDGSVPPRLRAAFNSLGTRAFRPPILSAVRSRGPVPVDGFETRLLQASTASARGRRLAHLGDELPVPTTSSVPRAARPSPADVLHHRPSASSSCHAAVPSMATSSGPLWIAHARQDIKSPARTCRVGSRKIAPARLRRRESTCSQGSGKKTAIANASGMLGAVSNRLASNDTRWQTDITC